MEKNIPKQGPDGFEQARIKFRCDILVEGDDIDGAVFRELTHIQNVTRRGAFVATSQRLEPGSLLSIFDAQDETNRLCYAQVVWTRGHEADGGPGVGIKLVGDNAKWIDHLVSRSIEILDTDEPDD